MRLTFAGLLLVWAAIRPFERRIVAILTALVIAGLAVAEAKAVYLGVIAARQLIPIGILQAILFLLFVAAYCGSIGRTGTEAFQSRSSNSA